MTDPQAYLDFPKLRHFYNKLWLSEKLGYYCGPGGLAPDKTGWFIMRPIMNLSGMGLGSKKIWIEAGDATKVPPGYFWCEWFDGDHISVTYENREGIFIPMHSYQAFRSNKNLSIFERWERVNVSLPIPKFIEKEIKDIKICNAEFIGDKLIEFHLRGTPDPLYDIVIPIWEKEQKHVDLWEKRGYNFINSFENADGFLKTPRLGFVVKNKEK